MGVPIIAESNESLKLERELVDIAKYTCASEVKEGVDYEISTMADGDIEFKLLGRKGGNIKGTFILSKKEWEGQQKVLIEDRAKLESEYKDCVVNQTDKLRKTYIKPASNESAEREKIVIEARDFVESMDVEVATGEAAIAYGTDVILNAPSNDYPARPNMALWEFYSKAAGQYIFYVTYASAHSRPVEIYLNGQLYDNKELEPTTGSWTTHKRHRVGYTDLKKGKNTVKFYRSNVFPHIRKLEFAPNN